MSERIVLVVDDDQGQRRIHRFHLNKLGLKVEEAGTEAEAMRKLDLNPDVVALDIHLDDSNYEDKHGYRLARAAKEKVSRISLLRLHHLLHPIMLRA